MSNGLKRAIKKYGFTLLLMIAGVCNVHAQPHIENIGLTAEGTIQNITIDGRTLPVGGGIPLFTCRTGATVFTSAQLFSKIKIEIRHTPPEQEDIHWQIVLRNISADTVQFDDLMPFDSTKSEAFITGRGDHPLSRTYLFLPGKVPVNVIVPDNAWELGYNAFRVNDTLSVAALTRREGSSLVMGTRKRFETILFPGGAVSFNLYVTAYRGAWQNGITKIFQQKMLYDVPQFNDSLFQRKDLQWIRHAYVIHLMDAWDKYYYDEPQKKYTLENFLQQGRLLYGGDDVVAIWPTWPALGLDQRNQFDLYRDLPGGTAAMKVLAQKSRRNNTRFFISYNPWDESTRQVDHLKGLSALISETSADGVVLDTRGGSNHELQEAADRVRPGVIMYSEGMAVPKDMQGIVSGRVHNALTHPPMLNLNKLIKPEFAIFRVTEINKGRFGRDLCTSFFNGYGTEINIMASGESEGLPEAYHLLGSSIRILRENTTNFTAREYTPLIDCPADSIWVNRWKGTHKTIYTIYSVLPQGFRGPLIAVDPDSDFHFVDLWRHRLLLPEKKQNKYWVTAETDAFHQQYSGTDNEGAVDCIARLPKLLWAYRRDDRLYISSPAVAGDEILVWTRKPSYDQAPKKFPAGHHEGLIHEWFGRFQGDLVIQLMRAGILQDETVVTIQPGTPIRISTQVPSRRLSRPPEGMVAIPSGKFLFSTTHGDEFIGYPPDNSDSLLTMRPYYMDRFPVTNLQFRKFLNATRYRPADTVNFLKHWVKGNYPAGQEQYPVVYISYEDARAYAAWAGKRLPTELEWQYAAQTPDRRSWPWKQQQPVTRKEEVVNETLTVTRLSGIEPGRCNLGNGKADPVGAYPGGVNPFGLEELVGSVWQMTNDVYDNGSHRYIMLKGGSYFNPSSSWWYVQGGPRELHYRQFLLRVSPGFERNATVGFRCMADSLEQIDQ